MITIETKIYQVGDKVEMAMFMQSEEQSTPSEARAASELYDTITACVQALVVNRNGLFVEYTDNPEGVEKLREKFKNRQQ